MLLQRRIVPRGLAAFALLLAAGAASAQQAPPQPPADALATLNDWFRTTYRATRAWRLSRVEPVIVVQFDDLHLIRGGQTRTEKFTPPIYHDYKAIAHIPLALYLKLAPATGRPFDKAMLESMTAYMKQIQAASASLDGRAGWTPEQLKTHKAIVGASLKFMERVMGAEEVKDAELTAYTRAMRPLLLASADAAAQAQLDGLHALVGKWRAELGAAWGQVHVVVLGPKQPRAGNVQYEYFVRTLGRAVVGKRLWYAEGVFDKDGGVNLLGTILVDRGASIAFFGDPVRLERDLLADGAQRHLSRLFPARR